MPWPTVLCHKFHMVLMALTLPSKLLKRLTVLKKKWPREIRQLPKFSQPICDKEQTRTQGSWWARDQGP